MKRLARLALQAALRAVVAYIHRERVRRAVATLDGCEYCGAPGVYFVDVTPHARHITSWLACTPCTEDAVRGGARVLMGADGRPVSYGI